MGKNIDFTQPGGFPVTQNQLNYMQDSYLPILAAFAAMGGNSAGQPIVIYGMEVSGGGNTVSDGCFVYNGDIILFTGGTVSPGFGDVALLLITEHSDPTPEPFYDSSTPDVLFDKTGTLSSGPSVGDTTHYPVSGLMRFGVTNWANPVYAGTFTADASSPIKYRKNLIGNFVEIKGVTDDPGSSVMTDTVIFTLPAGYRPAEEQIYVVPVTSGSDAYGLVRVKANGEVSLAGDLMTISTVPVWLNIRVPLG